MIGITLSADQIRTAPVEVRSWIEHQVTASLGLSAKTPVAREPHTSRLVPCNTQEAAAILTQVQHSLAAVNVLFEFGRNSISYGQPPMMAFRLLDIAHHTRLQNVGQVIACIDAINRAFAEVRHDESARFCVFDNEGHCFIAPQTQQSILQLWQDLLARQHAASGTEGASPGSVAPTASNGNAAIPSAFVPAGQAKSGEPMED